ncbi:hypothetical protein B0J13DRAFT_608811 [Dactylonectria estremocensis]|uniref:Cytokinin riboside 5'-monophosphate phosphoribohydrolase n=1 Tax=Dactylonectria estremocensis TaxID=1079267 RepID=A0A9P9ELP7_9HYPO|nr:hypothetical protein B0J13DRAFT_608811 [Dactylonectria estremocensis]
MISARKLAIAILGPTASGKTKLGVAIARAFLGEVISIDSLQCYRPGSIITAKPEPEETQEIPHHLIGYLGADEEPDDFVAMAIAKMEDITSRKRLPILVGGSTSLMIPLLSEAFKRRYQMLAITLVPNRSTYRLLIQARSDEMLERGLLDELSELQTLEQTLLNGEPNFSRGVWKAIGYQEFHSYLQSNGPAGDRERLFQNGRTSMYANTLQYGFHQLEWIRHTLAPFLHQEKAICISLSVTDKAAWPSEVEGPAISMASEFCHRSRVMRLPSKEASKSRVVCLFGGSSSGSDPVHIEAAKSLAVVLHRHDIELVYGGGTTGIMGAIASTLVELSGPSAVHGIIPAALARYEEKMTKALPDQAYSSRFGMRSVVRDMHTRKRLMIQSALDGAPGSGFVALSGGYGTMEELLEITTWYQLGIHKCGICVFSVNGFYEGLLDWIGQVARDGFVGSRDANILQVARSANEVVECLADQPQHSRNGELEWL